MACFKDAQEVYDTIGRLFVELAEDDELGPEFRKANTIVQYDYRDPDSKVTVRLEEGQPGDVDFGESEMEPEAVMSMEADTGSPHQAGLPALQGTARGPGARGPGQDR